MDTPPTPSVADAAPKYRYWAFISYSHHDEQWARWLHESLETYRIPKALRSHVKAVGTDGMADRLFPVFRDRDDLDGGFDLNERITVALQQARCLIVICSPHSARSAYVRQEIETFESLGREARVLCLVVDGEPGISGTQPEGAELECLSPPLRSRLQGGVMVPCEPLAADARKSKDGKTNAKLKIIASMLGVSFDDLKRREDERRLRYRIRVATVAAASAVLLTAGYLMALDSGAAAPGGDAFRQWLDGHEVSLLRPIPDESAIRTRAAVLKQTLVSRLEGSRGTSDSYPATFDGSRPERWAHNMALFAILTDPQGSASLATRPALPQFTPDMTAMGSRAISEFWGFMALARLADQPAAAGMRTQVPVIEAALGSFASKADAGGWSLFVPAPQPQPADAYTTAMALKALLEARRAGLPWTNSVDRRDQMIRSAFDWLVRHFNAAGDPPGWQAGTSSFGDTADGLTLQIFATLLDAEAEAGLAIPDSIVREIPRHLADTSGRDMEFPAASGEFTFDQDGPNERTEGINFLWHPWAIDATVRWLNREGATPLSTRERVAMRRVLGHLILDLGDEAIARVTRQFTFGASETLYTLSSIPAPEGTEIR